MNVEVGRTLSQNTQIESYFSSDGIGELSYEFSELISARRPDEIKAKIEETNYQEYFNGLKETLIGEGVNITLASENEDLEDMITIDIAAYDYVIKLGGGFGFAFSRDIGEFPQSPAGNDEKTWDWKFRDEPDTKRALTRGDLIIAAGVLENIKNDPKSFTYSFENNETRREAADAAEKAELESRIAESEGDFPVSRPWYGFGYRSTRPSTIDNDLDDLPF